MTDEQLRDLKRELDEVVALRDNLKATQERCNQLLEENRAQKRELAEQLTIINHLLQLIANTPIELTEDDVEVVAIPPIPGPYDDPPLQLAPEDYQRWLERHRTGGEPE